ncbi:GNAT family N-acetyltransferase [Pelosinus propionicus]|uniref:Acetyltransferase (GNAT) domain-containing protein n=1 Tax=Pelosinus propionicus DSM 13327 TaxID=1123291 RepID=A0A1I4MPS5_9FIRM|nr:GNAT family N-acetyltransferase [Pelosinus propionicus]SFM05056.1 Acetyltransferase (GNAT) domain-containing protein [Pelosinus propionicus DSM 13327]
MDDNKQKYRDLCEIEKIIPIFSKDWWLDAVCGDDNWDVVIIEKDGEIVASWPFYIKKSGFNVIAMPRLTQAMGIWISYPNGQKYTKRLAYEKKIFTDLIGRLPQVDMFSQNFHYSITNWLPLYWSGFQQATRYTYVIEDITDLVKVYNNFQSNIKTDIKKAQRTVNCYFDSDIDKFFNTNRLTFERQRMQMPYDIKFLKRLDAACSKRECRKIFYAQDEQGRIHAAIYIIWDEQSAYYLMGGGHPELRSSGATSLLLWKAIQFAATVTKKFDFEGSMIEPVERFFRAFGAVQKPYFSISKANRKMRVCQAVRDLGKALLKG